MAAPRKLPAAVHKRRGTYRPDRYGGVEPKVEMPRMPRGLSERSKAIWRTLTKLLAENQLISRMDGLALQLLCESADIYRQATESIQKNGSVLEAETLDGRTLRIINPACQIRDSAWAQIFKMCREFGLTAKARCSTKPNPQPASEVDLDGLLGFSIQ